MKFLMPHFMPLSSCLIKMILVSVLTLTCISITNKFPHFTLQDDHLAKALASKYPEVGLPSTKGPTILDANLRAEVVFRGLRYPTSMAFLGPNDILVTEKDAGTVRRIVNGTELQQALVDVTVSTYAHRGMLGIAITPIHGAALSNHGNANDHHDKTTIAYVFLYYTQA